MCHSDVQPLAILLAVALPNSRARSRTAMFLFPTRRRALGIRWRFPHRNTTELDMNSVGGFGKLGCIRGWFGLNWSIIFKYEIAELDELVDLDQFKQLQYVMYMALLRVIWGYSGSAKIWFLKQTIFLRQPCMALVTPQCIFPKRKKNSVQHTLRFFAV